MEALAKASSPRLSPLSSPTGLADHHRPGYGTSPEVRLILTPLRSRFPSARVTPVWNQADTEGLRQTALSMLEFLGEKVGLITCTLALNFSRTQEESLSSMTDAGILLLYASVFCP